MAYKMLIKNKWVLCNQEDNELLYNLEDFLAPFSKARYPDGTKLSIKDSMTVKDMAILRWCERRSIELNWIGRPSEINKDLTWSSPRMWPSQNEYLLVFDTPRDAMLFKLYFNSDSRADS